MVPYLILKYITFRINHFLTSFGFFSQVKYETVEKGANRDISFSHLLTLFHNHSAPTSRSWTPLFFR